VNDESVTVMGARAMHSIARQTAAPIIVVGLLLLAGCGPQGRTEIASGTVDGAAWSASAYRDNGVCVEVQAAGRDTQKVCGISDDGSWRTDAPGGGTFLAAWTRNTSAVRAIVSLRDGSSVEADAVPAPDVSDLRFLVWVLPASAHTTELELLDGADAVVGTWDLRGPGA
jgi:hypothetical protein